MLEWIIDNIQWIFSGVGVALIVAITNFFIVKRRRGTMSNQDEPRIQQTLNANDNTAGRDLFIQNIVKSGVSREEFSRMRSEEKKDMGRKKVQEWGEKMKKQNEWDWHLLEHAIEHYIEAIQLDPSHQHPWTNLAYVFRLVGEEKKAIKCLKKSKELAAPGPNYPGGNYKRVEQAVKNGKYLTGGKISTPVRPDWFSRNYEKYLK